MQWEARSSLVGDEFASREAMSGTESAESQAVRQGRPKNMVIKKILFGFDSD